MVLNLFKKASKIRAGIDISSEGFVLSCVSYEKGQYCLKGLYIDNFQEEILQNGMIIKPEVFAESLRKIIEENHLDIKTLNTGVSSSNMFIKIVAFPDISSDELKIIAPQEASKHVSQTVNQINVDYEILEQTKKDNKVDVVLCALSKEISNNLSNAASLAGVDINVIDVSSFAMIRTLANAEMINNPDLNYISVLIGYENTDINIIKNGMPVFSHHMQTGKKNVIESFMKGFEISKEEADRRLPYFGLILPGLEGSSDPDFNKTSNIVKPHYSNIASEIQKTIEFYNSQNGENTQIEKIILGGCGICLQNIDKYISNKLKIDTELCDSLKNISYDPKIIENIPVSIPSLSASIGLALYPY